MIPSKILEVTASLDVVLEALGIAVVRHPTDKHPATETERLEHLRWMCVQINDFVQTGQHDKANRWLGFVQGSMWTHGRITIDVLRKINKQSDDCTPEVTAETELRTLMKRYGFMVLLESLADLAREGGDHTDNGLTADDVGEAISRLAQDISIGELP